jgi:hypothetical protein
VLYASALTIFLVLAASSPRLVRAGIRSKRLGGNPALFGPDRRRGSGGAALAWAELQDIAEDYGIKASPSESPRQFSARLRDSRQLSGAESMNEQGRAAVGALTRDFERLEFGRPAEESAVPAEERIAAVRAALRANSSLWVRLRADWLPASVMAHWAALAASPFEPLWRWRHSGAELLGRALGRFRSGLDRITTRRP